MSTLKSCHIRKNCWINSKDESSAGIRNLLKDESLHGGYFFEMFPLCRFFTTYQITLVKSWSIVSNTQPRTTTTEVYKQLNCILRMHSLNMFAWEIFHSSRDDLWLFHATMGQAHESRRWTIFGLTSALDVAAVKHAPWHMANRRPFCTPH